MNQKKLSTRRDFLKIAGTTTASLAIPVLAEPSAAETAATHTHDRTKSEPRPSVEPSVEPIGYPRVFTEKKLSRIAFPLGGIGTGCIGLGGRGNLADWEIFNRADIGNSPQYAFPCIWVRAGTKSPVSRVLERRLLPPYDLKPDNLGSANVPGLPRLTEARFEGSFPIANIKFEDDRLPVLVSLEAYSSFQPVDPDISGIPCAILNYTVHNPTQEAADVVIAWVIDNPVGQGKKRQNEIRNTASASGLLMTDPSLTADDPQNGSFALSVLESNRDQIRRRRYWDDNSWNMGAQRFWFDTFSKTGDLGAETEPRSPIGSVAIRKAISPGESQTYRFLLTWHFPNRTPARCGWAAPKGEENALLGNHYCTRFRDAWDIAQHVSQNVTEIDLATRAFVHSLKSSTLPAVVVEAATANLSTLVTNTSFRIADGSFHGFEGCGDREGWGFGTCTHVWNYEVATQFVFPSLARSMRETSFGYATDANGHMDFRHLLPLGKEHWGPAAADGQMGQIVKLYLDWKLSGDDAWLRRLWPSCKRALEYVWRPGGWDGDKDGVMEGVQHNTYDIEFYGPNPLCESWYLAALKAGSEMASAVGDTDFGSECKRLFVLGAQWTDAHLYNGEYYVQHVRAIREDQIADGLRLGAGAKDPLHPTFQAGPGCLIDQLLGQYMADLAGLGLLLDKRHIRSTLRSIYQYNKRVDMFDAPSVERVFTLNDEGALLMCDYSKGERPEIPFPYYAENFTGSEYAASVLMLKYGMVKEGIECIANIRGRYDGEKANPYNEAEYGRHYARAMASWGAIPMLSGFLYDARSFSLEIKPLIHQNEFRCFWSTPTAWGNFHLRSSDHARVFELKPINGSIKVREMRFRKTSLHMPNLRITVGNKPVSWTSGDDEENIVITLAESTSIDKDEPLMLSNAY